MQINFYPEQDNSVLKEAVSKYRAIWDDQGSRIVDVIEDVSGLKFKEKIINAIIYSGISYSIPLRLQANVATVHKKGTLIHELCHRLVVGNNILISSENNLEDWNMTIHKHVDLVLYDIWVKLYGDGFAKKEIDYEISLWIRDDTSPYEIAWDWVLSMTKEERQELWKKSLRK